MNCFPSIFGSKSRFLQHPSLILIPFLIPIRLPLLTFSSPFHSSSSSFSPPSSSTPTCSLLPILPPVHFHQFLLLPSSTFLLALPGGANLDRKLPGCCAPTCETEIVQVNASSANRSLRSDLSNFRSLSLQWSSNCRYL